MAALIPNIAKGKVAYLASLPAANDALVWVVLTGTETDDNLRDADTLAAIIALAVDEATFTGYSRVVHTSSISPSVDDTNNWALVDDTTDPSWSPTSAQACTRIVVCYDPDTTTGTDADLIPLFIDDFAVTTQSGVGLSYAVAAGGFYKAA